LENIITPSHHFLELSKVPGERTMAIEQLFEALPLHYLQHGISKFGVANIALAVVVTAVLGVLADYAWMLYLRSKMVRMSSKFGHVEH
jgi:hypothetical protein